MIHTSYIQAQPRQHSHLKLVRAYPVFPSCLFGSRYYIYSTLQHTAGELYVEYKYLCKYVHTTAFSFEHAYSTTMIQSLPNLINHAAQAEMRVFADHLFDSCRAMSNNHVGGRAGAYQHSMYQNHQNTTQQPKLSSLV